MAQQFLPTSQNLARTYHNLPTLEKLTAEVQKHHADLVNYTEQYLAVEKASKSGLPLASMYVSVFDRLKVKLMAERDKKMEQLNETLKPVTAMLDDSYKDWCRAVNSARRNIDQVEGEISTVGEATVPPLGPTFVLMLNKMQSIHNFLEGTTFECEEVMTPQNLEVEKEFLECWLEEIRKAYQLHTDMMELMSEGCSDTATVKR